MMPESRLLEESVVNESNVLFTLISIADMTPTSFHTLISLM